MQDTRTRYADPYFLGALWSQDGSYVITDSEGKYSLCGVRPDHVLKIDRTTLPSAARMLPSSNRNAGWATALSVDMKGGGCSIADFIEGSCSSQVLPAGWQRRRAHNLLRHPQRHLRLPPLHPSLYLEVRDESACQARTAAWLCRRIPPCCCWR